MVSDKKAVSGVAGRPGQAFAIERLTSSSSFDFSCVFCLPHLKKKTILRNQHTQRCENMVSFIRFLRVNLCTVGSLVPHFCLQIGRSSINRHSWHSIKERRCAAETNLGCVMQISLSSMNSHLAPLKCLKAGSSEVSAKLHVDGLCCVEKHCPKIKINEN